MKLKNKKTGEVVEWFNNTDGVFPNSLAELNEEWEDYQEQKEYWYIDWNGEVCCSDIHDERTEQMKLIGNYFETEEEAEKAVGKLKAWKRLKDRGLKITGYSEYAYDTKSTHHIDIALDYARDEDRKDLDLLFGGEE